MKLTRKISPRERILKTAERLFHKHGYNEVGINQILEESNCAKASLYENFESKEELAKFVLRRYQAGTVIWLQKIIKNSETPTLFARNFQIAILKQIQSKNEIHRGCPVALFSTQLHQLDSFKDDFENFAIKWEHVLVKKIQTWKAMGLISEASNPKTIARFMLSLYEGCLVMWRISGNIEYIRETKHQLNIVFKS
ncbi:MAG: TetR/AcrR family transcriptional regulator [Leptospiraceae bacterium]|nr:TetR/AcrR family transcriptional regulator [Leptospiraceae bacterium]